MKFIETSEFLSPSEFMDRVKQLQKEYTYKVTEYECIEYLNAPAAFDTENTTIWRNTITGEIIPANVYAEKLEALNHELDKAKNKAQERKTLDKIRHLHDDNEAIALGYVWMFGLCGLCTYGRTYNELTQLIKELSNWLGDTRLPVYVHNLGYDFQFIEPYINIKTIFSVDTRTPVKILTTEGIEFRDSQILTNLKLETLAKKKLKKYKVQKLTGALDYNKIRHFKTPLDTQELNYCINDIKILMAYIQEILEEGTDDVVTIPMTATGYVRRDCRNKLLNNPQYMNQISQLQVGSVHELQQMMLAFRGGFTHANYNNSDRTIENVHSYDFTSSYPAVMVSRYMPMSKGRPIKLPITKKQFDKLIAEQCCIMQVHFDSITRRDDVADSYISENSEMRNIQRDNGRVLYAENVNLVITEIDYKIIRKCYETKGFRVASIYAYKRGLLPLELRKIVLEYYQKKTELKDIEEEKELYNYYKELLNSTYGMMVQKPFQNFGEFDAEAHEWGEKTPEDKINYKKILYKYNHDKKRFTFYPWGLYITAHARANLWSGILALGDDYIYADTDSVKVMNIEQHREYFDQYNKTIEEQMASLYNVDEYAPKTVKGERKPLGVWNYEGKFDKFKTLGAKKYITQQGDRVEITVAGVAKEDGSKYFAKLPDTFEQFTDGKRLSPENCGRLIHEYIDEPKTVTVTDYLGNTETVTQLKGIALTPSTYRIGITEEYQALVQGKRLK